MIISRVFWHHFYRQNLVAMCHTKVFAFASVECETMFQSCVSDWRLYVSVINIFLFQVFQKR
jgi:hypothetical protein